MILEEVIAEDFKPQRRGGIMLYPAPALELIFDWAKARSRQLDWVEGGFTGRIQTRANLA